MPHHRSAVTVCRSPQEETKACFSSQPLGRLVGHGNTVLPTVAGAYIEPVSSLFKLAGSEPTVEPAIGLHHRLHFGNTEIDIKQRHIVPFVT